MILVTVLISIVAVVAMASYREYIERTEINIAIQDIMAMQLSINAYAFNNNGVYPESLSDVGLGSMRDPWGNTYHYLNIANAGRSAIGASRKDRNLVPINSDYDLYSAGPDGETVPPLTASSSRDDIVRANNGGFVGEAEDY